MCHIVGKYKALSQVANVQNPVDCSGVTHQPQISIVLNSKLMSLEQRAIRKIRIAHRQGGAVTVSTSPATVTTHTSGPRSSTSSSIISLEKERPGRGFTGAGILDVGQSAVCGHPIGAAAKQLAGGRSRRSAGWATHRRRQEVRLARPPPCAPRGRYRELLRKEAGVPQSSCRCSGSSN